MPRSLREVLYLGVLYVAVATGSTLFALQLPVPEQLECWGLSSRLDVAPDCTHAFTPAEAVLFGATAALVITVLVVLVLTAWRWRRGHEGTWR